MLKHASNVEIMLKHVNIVLINASNMFKPGAPWRVLRGVCKTEIWAPFFQMIFFFF